MQKKLEHRVEAIRILQPYLNSSAAAQFISFHFNIDFQPGNCSDCLPIFCTLYSNLISNFRYIGSVILLVHFHHHHLPILRNINFLKCFTKLHRVGDIMKHLMCAAGTNNGDAPIIQDSSRNALINIDCLNLT